MKLNEIELKATENAAHVFRRRVDEHADLDNA